MAWTTISTVRGDTARDLSIEVKECNGTDFGVMLVQEDGEKVYVSKRQMGKLQLILEMQLEKIKRGL